MTPQDKSIPQLPQLTVLPESGLLVISVENVTYGFDIGLLNTGTGGGAVGTLQQVHDAGNTIVDGDGNSFTLDANGFEFVGFNGIDFFYNGDMFGIDFPSGFSFFADTNGLNVHSGFPFTGDAPPNFGNTNKGTTLLNLTAAQRDQLTGVTQSALIFNKTLLQPQFWDGTQWVTIGGGGDGSIPTLNQIVGNNPVEVGGQSNVLDYPIHMGDNGETFMENAQSNSLIVVDGSNGLQLNDASGAQAINTNLRTLFDANGNPTFDWNTPYTLQKGFNASVAAGDNPTLNVSGNSNFVIEKHEQGLEQTLKTKFLMSEDEIYLSHSVNPSNTSYFSMGKTLSGSQEEVLSIFSAGNLYSINGLLYRLPSTQPSVGDVLSVTTVGSGDPNTVQSQIDVEWQPGGSGGTASRFGLEDNQSNEARSYDLNGNSFTILNGGSQRLDLSSNSVSIGTSNASIQLGSLNIGMYGKINTYGFGQAINDNDFLKGKNGVFEKVDAATAAAALLSSLPEYTDDSAAGAGGVGLGQPYFNTTGGYFTKVR